MATLQAPPLQTPAPVSPEDLRPFLPTRLVRARPLLDPEILRRAIKDSSVKLNPLRLLKNPVMFVVEVSATLVTVLLLRDIFEGLAGKELFEVQIAIWLWFTVLFANFAEAMAEARGKAQAETLRKTKTDSIANRVSNGKVEVISASKLRAGDIVIASAGELIPGDGEVVEGIATVDESVITGESAPVIRES